MTEEKVSALYQGSGSTGLATLHKYTRKHLSVYIDHVSVIGA